MAPVLTKLNGQEQHQQQEFTNFMRAEVGGPRIVWKASKTHFGLNQKLIFPSSKNKPNDLDRLVHLPSPS